MIIDEAGMADTLTLDAAVQFAIGRGASVRLVGDDQQLAAIGAGGVLRHITHTHGAPFISPSCTASPTPPKPQHHSPSGTANPKSLGFYLDHGRVHVGDMATTTDDAFHAWVSDRAAGSTRSTLAPTRKLVAELNRQAHDHCLGSHPAAARCAWLMGTWPVSER